MLTMQGLLAAARLGPPLSSRTSFGLVPRRPPAVHLFSSGPQRGTTPTIGRAFYSSRPPRSALTNPSNESRTSPDSTAPRTNTLSHIDPRTGKASMVDVSSKSVSKRTATAEGKIYLNEQAFSLIDFGSSGGDSDVDAPRSRSTPSMRTKKGDVLTIVQLAGIMGSKQTSTLIPLCHPVALSHVSVTLSPSRVDRSIEIRCTATSTGQTGVEMEALVGVSIAGLTVWDMCKAVAGDEMVLGEIKVVEKAGGTSGDWKREG
ncbi:hypothetical protein JCM10212_000823 [Sporobolomyces blumeae]